MKYLVIAKIQIEVEANNKEDAQVQAGKVFDTFTDAKISEAKIADKNSGYFI